MIGIGRKTENERKKEKKGGERKRERGKGRYLVPKGKKKRKVCTHTIRKKRKKERKKERKNLCQGNFDRSERKS